MDENQGKGTDADSATDESGAVSLPSHAHESKAGMRQALRARIQDKDYLNAASVNYILEDLDRVNSENRKLQIFVGKYYDADKKCAVLTVEKEGWRRGDILYTVCITAGGAILGAATSFEGNQV